MPLLPLAKFVVLISDKYLDSDRHFHRLLLAIFISIVARIKK
jgi:hypothetical protein